MLDFELRHYVVMAISGAIVHGVIKYILPKVRLRYMCDFQGPVLSVVITGSTKGVGLALATAFLQLGDNVVISSRVKEHVDMAVKQLKSVGSGKVMGVVCDVREPEAVDALIRRAVDDFGAVDVLINNAGVTQETKQPVATTPADVLRQVIDTNLLGTILASQAAVKQMLKQGHGHVFLTDGNGSNGGGTPNSAIYGATKAALPQFAKSLEKEVAGTGVCVSLISPGMVITDLLMTSRTPSALKAFNVLCERPATVAAWLVPRIRYVARRQQSGHYLRFLTKSEAAWRCLTFFKRQNRFFDATGKMKPE